MAGAMTLSDDKEEPRFVPRTPVKRRAPVKQEVKSFPSGSSSSTAVDEDEGDDSPTFVFSNTSSGTAVGDPSTASSVENAGSDNSSEGSEGPEASDREPPSSPDIISNTVPEDPFTTAEFWAKLAMSMMLPQTPAEGSNLGQRGASEGSKRVCRDFAHSEPSRGTRTRLDVSDRLSRVEGIASQWDAIVANGDRLRAHQSNYSREPTGIYSRERPGIRYLVKIEGDAENTHENIHARVKIPGETSRSGSGENSPMDDEKLASTDPGRPLANHPMDTSLATRSTVPFPIRWPTKMRKDVNGDPKSCRPSFDFGTPPPRIIHERDEEDLDSHYVSPTSRLAVLTDESGRVSPPSRILARRKARAADARTATATPASTTTAGAVGASSAARTARTASATSGVSPPSAAAPAAILSAPPILPLPPTPLLRKRKIVEEETRGGDENQEPQPTASSSVRGRCCLRCGGSHEAHDKAKQQYDCHGSSWSGHVKWHACDCRGGYLQPGQGQDQGQSQPLDDPFHWERSIDNFGTDAGRS